MKVVIVGGGGFAKEIIDLIEDSTSGRIIGYVDKKKNNSGILKYPYLGCDEELNIIIKKYKLSHFFVAIGDTKRRSFLYLKYKKMLTPITIISRKAHISKYAKFGEHVVVYPFSVVSTEVSIGNNVIIYSNSFLGHESVICDHVNINPGVNVAGNVFVDEYSTIGIGASIKERVRIASNTFVGAGAVVVNNTKPNNTYIGVPAEIIK